MAHSISLSPPSDIASQGIIRKWLEALKADTFEPKIFEHFQNAFKSMLAANLTAEHLRSFSMYITYAAHSCRERYSDEIAAKSDPVRPGNASTPGRRCTIPKSPRSPVMLTNDHSNKVTLSQTMIRMLEIYVDLLCSPGDTVNIRKFAKTVTNKVHISFSKSRQDLLTSKSGFFICSQTTSRK